ncbi:hypothetical protein [Chryseobacterium sp.]|uniref:hypothetical protein n=1 Tax=Chryseobacterium sp. TaxID=1871047 RepID=UPI0028969571|nr:hypothetical protein [Chryseobacterium sp.]
MQPFERLWIRSLTEKAISEGFRNLQPENSYDPLYKSQKSEADWLVDIYVSKALILAGDG